MFENVLDDCFFFQMDITYGDDGDESLQEPAASRTDNSYNNTYRACLELESRHFWEDKPNFPNTLYNDQASHDFVLDTSATDNIIQASHNISSNSLHNTSTTLQHNLSTASAANSTSNANRLSEKVENIARAIYTELEHNVKNYGEQSMPKG